MKLIIFCILNLDAASNGNFLREQELCSLKPCLLSVYKFISNTKTGLIAHMTAIVVITKYEEKKMKQKKLTKTIKLSTKKYQ